MLQVVVGQAQQQNDAAGQAVMDMPYVVDDGSIVFMSKLDHGESDDTP